MARLLASPKRKNARRGNERTIFEATPLWLRRKFEMSSAVGRRGFLDLHFSVELQEIC
jgi:hypothetical protein